MPRKFKAESRSKSPLPRTPSGKSSKQLASGLAGDLLVRSNLMKLVSESLHSTTPALTTTSGPRGPLPILGTVIDQSSLRPIFCNTEHFAS
jgi:hypothetical protein